MKNYLKILTAGLLISQILLNSCKGPAGDPGPAGKDGNPGTDGKAGAAGGQGVAGAAGATGTANVIYGNWVNQNNTEYWYKLSGSLPKSNFAYSSNENYGWGSNFAAPITQDILDKGLIYVYAKYEKMYEDKKVYLLPTTILTLNRMEAYTGLNRIYLANIFPTSNVGSVYQPAFYPSQFRYVIIPGSINGRKPAIDFSDYNAVKAYYNLKD
jgi:hypothetical protein